jgi:hypothetical protein
MNDDNLQCIITVDSMDRPLLIINQQGCEHCSGTRQYEKWILGCRIEKWRQKKNLPCYSHSLSSGYQIAEKGKQEVGLRI